MKKKYICILMLFILLGVIIMPVPRRDQFSSITSPNNLKLITSNHNIAKYGGTQYKGIPVTTGANTNRLTVFSYPSLTGAETNESALTSAFAGNITNVICRNFGDEIYAYGTIIDAGTPTIYHIKIDSQDGGDTWNTAEVNGAHDANTSDVRAIDIVDIGGTVHILYSEMGLGGARFTSRTWAGGAATLMTTCSGPNSILAGNVLSDVYYFIAFDGADMKEYSWNAGGAATDLGSTGITNPSLDAEKQGYYRTPNGDRYAIAEDYMYRYNKISGIWTEKTAASTAFGIVWGHNSDNDYIWLFAVWGGEIWDVKKGGAMVSIQTYTGVAYCGYGDWFSEGTDYIYQLGYSSFAAHSFIVNQEVEKAPNAQSLTVAKPSEAYYNFHRAIITGLVDWGTFYNPDISAWTIGANATGGIIAEENGHRDIFEYTKTTGAFEQIYLDGWTETSGTVEGYALVRQTDGEHWILLRNEAGAVSCIIAFKANAKIYVYDGAGATEVLAAYTANTWYHFKFIFDCATDTYDVYIDGVLEADDFDFWNNATSIRGIFFQNRNVDTKAIVWDGLGLSWDGYVSGSGYETQIFEGIKITPTTIGGLYKTHYISGIQKDLGKTVSIAATNATPHAWIKSIIDTYCSHIWYDEGIDDQYGALDFPAIDGKSVAYCFRVVSLLKQHWFYYTPDNEVFWDDGTKYSGQNIVWGTDPLF